VLVVREARDERVARLRYEIDVGGRTREVVVTRLGGGEFAVSVDRRTWKVDAARIDAHTLSLIVDTMCSHEVTLVPDAATGGLVVHVGVTPIAVTVNGRRRWRRQDEPAGTGPHRVTAPMPGKIVRVLVNPGDTVRARQPLVVVEAMKMENELRAGRDGTIAEMHAREGASVEAGTLLVVIQ
jgi:biotin carboxyl carrier protein